MRHSSPVIIESNVPQDVAPHVQIETQDEQSMVYDSLVSQAAQRDMFSANGTSVPIQAIPTGQLPDSLRVVGIVSGVHNQIVIEDSTAKETYFLNEGESKAGIMIKNFQSDKVIISYQGQDIAVSMNQQNNNMPGLNAVIP